MYSVSTSYRYYQPLYRNHHLILDPDGKERGGLYLGDMTAALNTRELKKKGINSVLTAAARLGIYYYKNEVDHKAYPALDIESYDISKYFEDSFNYIDQALKKGSVLVHCAAGISRSSTIVIAYLMKKYGWSYETAYKLVKKKRNVISPNSGFVKQLKSYEKQLMAAKK